MIYPGDIKNIVLSITNPNGGVPNVTVAPVVTIIRVSTLTTVVSAAAMTAVAGTQQVYIYSWNTAGQANDDYLAIVSYAHDSITVNSQLLESFHIGDSRITGSVALDATVAKDGTVAKDLTVAHITDLTAMNPNNSTLVQSIAAKTNNLPADPASLTAPNAIGVQVQAIFGSTFGTWTIDKTQNPQLLTILDNTGATLATFTLTDSTTQTQKTPGTVPTA